MKSSRRAFGMLALISATVLTATACTSASSAPPEEVGAKKSAELHATVLDEQLASLDASLPAIDVKLSNGLTVPFAKGESLKVAFNGYGKG
ncbi:MAG: hypothetical protein JWQ68_1827, partial [Cryobacterium sp.]|nr:hypothetical protein [Cryobacterium sp.]